MGVDTLQEFARCLLDICANATNITQVAEALSEENVIDCLGAAWDEIPKESRTIIVNRLHGKKSRSTKPPSKKKVTINKDVEPLLKSWGENPSTFTLPATTLQIGLDHPAQLYVSLTELDRNRAVDAVRWRLYLLAFCELKDKLERVTVRGKTARVFENIIFNSNLVADSFDEVVQKCSLWANLGRRYQKIALGLGGRGSLIVFPDDIARYKLEHTIPMKKGTAYDTLIQGLKERGICEEATRLDAHRVADGILEYLCPKSCTWLESRRLPLSARPNSKRRQFHNSTSRRPPPPQSTAPLSRASNANRGPLASDNVVTSNNPVTAPMALSQHFHGRDGINFLYDAIQADKESAPLPDFYSDQNQPNADNMEPPSSRVSTPIRINPMPATTLNLPVVTNNQANFGDQIVRIANPGSARLGLKY